MKHISGVVKGVEITSVKELQFVMAEIASLCKLSVVGTCFHQFDPHGATGVLLLSESHLACHTWPERECVSVDLFCCSADFQPHEAARHIEEALHSAEVVWKIFDFDADGEAE
jgi:S-adenosylmethionine decarboxylase